MILTLSVWMLLAYRREGTSMDNGGTGDWGRWVGEIYKDPSKFNGNNSRERQKVKRARERP
jgi:hypothetical protein